MAPFRLSQSCLVGRLHWRIYEIWTFSRYRIAFIHLMDRRLRVLSCRRLPHSPLAGFRGHIALSASIYWHTYRMIYEIAVTDRRN